MRKIEPLPINKQVALYYKTPVEAIEASLTQLSEQIAWLVAEGWVEEKITTYIRLFDTDEDTFRRIVDDIDADKFGAVFVFSVDRLFSDVELGIFINACQSNNVEVLTPAERYNLSDDAELRKLRDHHDAYTNYIKYREHLKVMCECWEMLKGRTDTHIPVEII